MKTPRENAKEGKQNQLVNNLQELLVKNYDANKGFKKAISEVRNTRLKDYFKVQAFLHHRYATQIDRLIHTLNYTPKEEGSTAGRLRRVWIDVMLAISGNDDKTVFQECKRGQSATLNEYRNKLRNHKFPREIKEILKKHLVELELTSNDVNAIKES